MLEINVTVHVPGLPEAINALANAIAGKSTNVPAAIGASATQPEAVTAPVAPTAAPVANPTQAVASATVAVPTANTPPAPPANAPAAPAVQSGPAPTSSPSNTPAYTIDQLSVAGAALCEQGKMPQLIALLGKYGVQAVTQLSSADAATINAFGAELKALGANV